MESFMTVLFGAVAFVVSMLLGAISTVTITHRSRVIMTAGRFALLVLVWVFALLTMRSADHRWFQGEGSGTPMIAFLLISTAVVALGNFLGSVITIQARKRNGQANRR
jgi:uncharacterized integral membrane protein